MAAVGYTFPRSHRLSGKERFARVFAAGVKHSRGPLVAFAIPNDLGHPRLGLSVPRRVGTAARRVRIKRLIREAFRLHQYDLPAGYDFVVVVRPHEPFILAEYLKLLTAMMVQLHGVWQKRSGAPASRDG